MWRIENPYIRKNTLDFTASGQPKFEVSQLVSGETVLMNALDLMEWNEHGTQVEICRCGIVGCETGGWINLRRAGDIVMMIPVYDEIEDDAWSSAEYAPPRYFRMSGRPYFTIDDYQTIVEKNVGFPSIDKLSNLKMSEAVRLVQAEMPYQMFGEPPFVQLTEYKRDLVVAASKGDHKQHLKTIERLLRTHYEDATPAHLRYLEEEDAESVYLFLDADEFVDWRILVETDSGSNLVLDDNWALEDLGQSPAELAESDSVTR